MRCKSLLSSWGVVRSCYSLQQLMQLFVFKRKQGAHSACTFFKEIDWQHHPA